MPGIRNSYQEGSIVRTARAKGPDQWVYRWRETQPDGTGLRRSKIVGDLMHYPTKADAKRLVENFRSELNSASPVERIGSMTVAEAWGHFQANELRDPDVPAELSAQSNALRLGRWMRLRANAAGFHAAPDSLGACRR